MIARDSKSYPYLAIAQHYNIPYADVLIFADTCKKLDVLFCVEEWCMEVWKLVQKDKRNETVSHMLSIK